MSEFPVDLLLTDGFVKFSEHIKEIKEIKEKRTAEMKAAYAAYQQEMADYDEKVKRLYEEFATLKQGE